MNKKTNTIILGIESSCDETAASVVKFSQGKFFVLSNIVSSQVKIHAPYGGVVPELAARNHIKNILPVINQAIEEAKVKPGQISKIAVTIGPGLITSLLVGVETAKILAYLWQKPIVPVNHLIAHIYANWLGRLKTEDRRPKGEEINFPALCLVVSGGHTELILMKGKNIFKKIGQTLDDAAGESFDKVAQLLGLGYPGGPIIAAEAAKFKNQNAKFKIRLPRPMIDSNDYNFSFAGLKTAVLYTLKRFKARSSWPKANICAEFQQAVVDVLVKKTLKSAKDFGVKTVILSGGVAANKELRLQLKKAVEKQVPFAICYMPLAKYCTDNAAMVAIAGYFGKAIPWSKVKVDPNLEIK